MVYSTRRFIVCLSVCHFVLVFFSPFSIAITSLGEERANLSAFSYVCSICASGGAKVLCILHHRGVQLILAYSWARLLSL